MTATPPEPDRLPHAVLDSWTATSPADGRRTRLAHRARRSLSWKAPNTPWWASYSRVRPAEFGTAAMLTLACCLLLGVLTGHIHWSEILRLVLAVYVPAAVLALVIATLTLAASTAITSARANGILRRATEDTAHDRQLLREQFHILGIRDPATLAATLRLAAEGPTIPLNLRARLLHLADIADPTGRYAPLTQEGTAECPTPNTNSPSSHPSNSNQSSSHPCRSSPSSPTTEPSSPPSPTLCATSPAPWKTSPAPSEISTSSTGPASSSAPCPTPHPATASNDADSADAPRSFNANTDDAPTPSPTCTDDGAALPTAPPCPPAAAPEDAATTTSSASAPAEPADAEGTSP